MQFELIEGVYVNFSSYWNMPHTKNAIQISNDEVVRPFCQLLKAGLKNRTVINICCCFLILCCKKHHHKKLFILPNKLSKWHGIPFAAANLIYLLFIFILLERAQHNNKATSVKNSSKNFFKKTCWSKLCADNVLVAAITAWGMPSF